VVVVEAIDVAVLDGGLLVLVFDVLALLADFPPPHDVTASATNPRETTARQNPLIL
jgi:hypothetical protein